MDNMLTDYTEQGIKNYLIIKYVPVLLTLGIPENEVDDLFNNMFTQVVKELGSQEANKYIPNFGELFLEKSKIHEPTKNYLESLYQDGVTDNDIIGYYKKHIYERALMYRIENFIRTTNYLYQEKIIIEELKNDNKHLSQDEIKSMIVEKVKKYLIIYGESSKDSQATNPNDLPLPYMLRDRINEYIMNQDEKSYRENIKKYSTCNAYIRAQIKDGNL